MVTAQPKEKNVKRLPDTFFPLFSDYEKRTINEWVKKKVCFGDKTLYKYISESIVRIM